VDVVEFTDEFLQVCWGQLFDDVVLDELNKQVVRVPCSDGLEARKFGKLLLLLFLGLLLGLLLFLSFLLCKHHHVRKLLFDHIIDELGLLFLDLRAHSNDSHIAVISLVRVLGLVTVGPVKVVVLVELIKLKHNFRWSNLSYLLVITIIFASFLFLVFFTFIFRLLVFFTIAFGCLGCFLFGTHRCLKVVALVELGDILWHLTVSLGLLLLDPLTTFIQHVLHDVDTLNGLDIVFKLLFSKVKHDHVVLLELLAVFISVVHFLDWVIVLELFFGFRFALHS